MVGLLVLASLAMITVYFRESPNGGLHDFQSAASSVLRPFEIAANRVARPFRGRLGTGRPTSSTRKARTRSSGSRSRTCVSRRSRRRSALEDRNALRRILRIKRAPAYEDFANTAVTAEVVSNPVSQFDQTMVIAAGRSSGIRVYDAVVTERGLVGQVTKVLRDTALVTLLTDKESAVTAKDQRTGAIGIVRHSQGPEDLLFLDRVCKNKVVNTGDIVVTAGKQSGKQLSSFYPRRSRSGR